jgi:hypothetical protein
MAKKRIVTGLKGIPLDHGFSRCDYYFSYDLDKKDIANLVKRWVRKSYSKADASAILANAEWNFHMHTGIGAAVHWMSNGLPFPEKYEKYPDHVKKYFKDLINKGKEILKAKHPVDEIPKRILSPKERLLIKIDRTVMVDIDQLEDEWYNGEKTSLDIVASFRIHELKGMAVDPVKSYLKRMIPEYEDAYNKTCKDAYDAYKHLGRRELSRRIKLLNSMIADLDKFKEDSKAKRKPRRKTV